MFENKTIAVVVPCYSEQAQIDRVLVTMPGFVDCIIVVDDKSRDDTVGVVRRRIDARGHPGRLVLIEHETNRGVGAAIVTGYKEAVRQGMDVAAVMAGDGQMDPGQLHLLVGPVARGQADYAKANRLFYAGAWGSIPRHRYMGNAFLSMLTKIASGYWHVADSQSGYTAISRQALEILDLDAIYPQYGYPNDLLVRLNVFDFRVADVHMRPVYNVGERSKMRLWKIVPTMTWLIFKRFCWRMKHKYVIRDFHPLVLFYLFGSISLTAGFLFGLYLLVYRFLVGTVAPTSGLFSVMLFTSGLQLLLFAMWFDMTVNRHLRVDAEPESPVKFRPDSTPTAPKE
jgi:glycosyltransferase involved in cell wall biosynthesis